MESRMAGLVERIIPPLNDDSYKGQAGRIGILGGCEDYTGAPYFAGMTALRQGADLTHIFCEEGAAAVIKSYSPDLIVHPYLRTTSRPDTRLSADQCLEKISVFLPRLHSLVVGPGLGRDPKLLEVVPKVVEAAKKLGLSLVFDADGLFWLQSNFKTIKGYHNVTLTPNVMEFEKLCSGLEIPFNRLGNEEERKKSVLLLSQSLGNIAIVLKGKVDLISDGKQVISCSVQGSPRRCGGQGDILSGSVGTFSAWADIYRKKQGVHEIDGVSLGILAAFGGCLLTRRCSFYAFEKLGRSYTTTDLIPEIHRAFASLFPSSL